MRSVFPETAIAYGRKNTVSVAATLCRGKKGREREGVASDLSLRAWFQTPDLVLHEIDRRHTVRSTLLATLSLFVFNFARAQGGERKGSHHIALRF